MNNPDQARTKAAADLIEQLAQAADHNWGTHYPCLRDDLSDLAHDLRTGKTTPTIERIIAVLAPNTLTLEHRQEEHSDGQQP